MKFLLRITNRHLTLLSHFFRLLVFYIETIITQKKENARHFYFIFLKGLQALICIDLLHLFAFDLV